MPPKKPEKKAPVGASDEDLADLSSLPHIKTMTMSIAYHFYIKDNLNLVKSMVENELKEGLHEDPNIQLIYITREEILEIAQAKVEEINQGIENQDEHKKVDSQLLARCFTEKMVELGLPLRRERKQNQANEEGKHDESAKADIMFNLVEYPRTQDEFDHFVKLRNPLNKVILINERKPKDFDKLLEEQNKPKPEGEGDENAQPPAEGEGEAKPELIQDEEREKPMNFVRMYDHKCFKAPNDSVLKLSDIKIVDYKHEIVESEGSSKNSIKDLKSRLISEIEASQENLFRYCQEKLRKAQVKPNEGEAKEEERKEEQPPVASPEDGEDKPKPKPELVPAGYQEAVQKVPNHEEEGVYGKLSVPSPKKQWYSFEVYAKNTTRISPEKTTVGHLLLCAIKQAGKTDTEKQDGLAVDENLYELEKALKQSFVPIDTSSYFKEKEETKSTKTLSKTKSQARSRVLENNSATKSHIVVEEKLKEDSKESTNIISKEEVIENSKPASSQTTIDLPYHSLFNKLDQLSLQNYSLTSLDGCEMSHLERTVLQHLLIPGQGRHRMPHNAQKSLPVRKSDLNEILTFSTIGAEPMQRALILRDFETMMKEKEQEREWSFFDRNYVRNYSQDVLKYELSRALLLDPSLATRYYPLEDGLLCAIYFKNPPGRIIRHQWTVQPKEIPDFRAYLQSVYSDEYKSPNLDPHADTKFFGKTSLIKCNEKKMYPSDNSVIRTIKCDIGNKVIGRNTIIKDNFTFGISEKDGVDRLSDQYYTIQEKDQQDRSCEFWCNLADPTVRFFVESENVDNIYDEEYQQQCFGAAPSMTFKSGLIVKFLPSMEVMQSQTSSFRKFKQKVVDIAHPKEDSSNIELRRLITKHGTVIRYMKDKSIQIMMSNSNFSVFNPKSNSWIKTKNDGTRKEYKINKETGKVVSIVELEPVEVEHKIDPETNVNITVRSDKVMLIYGKKGSDDGAEGATNDEQPDSTLAMHHDDTRILTKNNGSVKIIEKDGFAPIKITFDAFKSRAKTVIGLGGTNALMGYDSIMERSNDGFLIETHLPDKTLVQSYKEKQQLEGYNNFSDNTIHLFRMHDYSILKVKQDGEIVVITSNLRAKLNDIGYALDLGKDKDYFFELFGVESDRRSGVYTCDVLKGTIQTKDDEGNIFTVFANGESIEKLAVSFDLDQTAESLARKRPDSPRNLPDGEYIEEECKFLVPPQSVMDPRLIFIKNDESGCEFFNEKQLEYFFRARSVDTESISESNSIKIGNEKVTLISSLKELDQNKRTSLIFPETKIPQCVSPATQTVYIPPEPYKKMYASDQLIEFSDFESSGSIDKFDDDLVRYQHHKQLQEEEKQRLKVVESELEFRSKDKVFEEMKFFYTILKMKGKKKKHMTEAELKIWNMRREFSDTEDHDEDLYSTDEDNEEIDVAEDD